MKTPRPPALLRRTLAVTFTMAAVLLAAIFTIVLVTVRSQVRDTVRAHLESSQRMFAALESRGQRERRLQAANAAESPTLKAAIDTYAAEARHADAAVTAQLLNTVTGELARVAARVEADAVVVLDTHQTALSASGPFGNRWPPGQRMKLVADTSTTETTDGIVHAGDEVFRVVMVPLELSDGGTIGTLCLATSLDRRFARELGDLSNSQTVIVANQSLVASTLPADAERDVESALRDLTAADGTLDMKGESYAYRRVFEVGDTRFYALASIDASSDLAIQAMTQTLAFIGLGAICLALLGSIWLAKTLSEPIGRLSASLHAMATSRQFDRLPPTGSSLEVDRLTETFNDLMSSVAAAEAETQTAYTAAIRALAATLDARDPYTAGHSERVSVLAVAIGREMDLPDDELEVLRLGALLHDIGKIGVPDEILRKVGPLAPDEIDVIKEHPGLGARILRTVPFLAPHVPIVELHHERPDGAGYPHGLRSDDIPLAAHIVHVADAYDAMTSARAYRPGRGGGAALRELWSGAGTEFHAESVRALAAVLPALTVDDETEIVREAHVA